MQENQKISSHAAAAKQIKQALKKAFPTIKFSVKSDTYSGGNSVSIHWTDGPRTELVKAIAGKYQYGSFDGMTDSYDFNNKIEGLPQVQYVMEQRNMSPEAEALIIREWNATHTATAQIINTQDRNKDYDEWNSTLIYREFNKRSFCPGVFQVYFIAEDGTKFRHDEEFYNKDEAETFAGIEMTQMEAAYMKSYEIIEGGMI